MMRSVPTREFPLSPSRVTVKSNLSSTSHLRRPEPGRLNAASVGPDGYSPLHPDRFISWSNSYRISLTANHMQLVSPFLPGLTWMLSS